MAHIIKFKGADNVDYEFPLNLSEEKVAASQFENFKILLKISKETGEFDTDRLARFTDTFWDFIAHDFFKAYPDHYLAKYYNKIEGISEMGKPKLAGLVGDVDQLANLTNQILGVTENSNKPVTKQNNVTRRKSKANSIKADS